MTVTITLTISGSNTGPFDLYSDTDGYTTAFESAVARASLIAGYTTALVPDGTNTIRLVSTGECTNYIDISVIPYTTTTTSTSSTTTSTSTTTTTTTAAPTFKVFYQINTTYATCTPDQNLNGSISVDSTGAGGAGPVVVDLSSGSFDEYYGNIDVTDSFYISPILLTLECSSSTVSPTYFRYWVDGFTSSNQTNFLVSDPYDGMVVYMEISDADNIPVGDHATTTTTTTV